MRKICLRPIPRCPSAIIFCGCDGVCSQTAELHSDDELIRRGYEPPLLLTEERRP